MNEYFIFKHIYNIVKTVNSRTVSTGQKGSKSTYKCPKRYVSKYFSMAPHIRSHRAPCSCFPKKVSLQSSSEQSIGDVGITQLDWKRIPQARSRGCKSSVATTAE